MFGKLFSQTPVYENYTTENGLASDFVYCIFQDSKGLIWIGTDDGVSTYDGKAFTNFNIADGLSDKEILKIFEDKQGRIWFTGFNGKVSFYYENKIHNQYNTPWLKYINTNDFIIDYYIDDATKNIYLLNKFSCFLINPQNVVKKIVSNNNDSISFHAIVEINHKIHIICSNKLIDLNGSKSTLNWKHRFPPLSYIYHNGKNEQLVFINSPAKYISNWANDKIEYPNLLSNKGNAMQGIYQTTQNVFIGATSGLYKIQKATKNIQHLFHDFSVTYIIGDYQDGIWFGSSNKGIIYIPNQNIEYYESETKSQYKNIESIDNQPYIFDDFGNILKFTDNKTVLVYKDKKSTQNQIYSVKQIDSLNYYLCNTGIINLNISKGSFIKENNSVSIKDIELINDYAYVATSYGLLKVLISDLKKNGNVLSDNTKTKNIISEYTKHIIKYKHKLFAFGVYGIKEIKYDKAYNLNVKPDFINIPINAVKKDQLKNVYIAYSGLGIATLNLETSRVEPYETPKDLLDCSQLYIDAKNDLWLLAKNNIYKLNTLTKQFKKIVSDDAFINNKILDFIINDSSIIAISKHKIFKIPVDFKNKVIAPKSIEFTSISFNNKLYRDTIINMIQAAENVLRFNFKSNVFNKQSTIIYEYHLKGIDKTIHYTKANEIRYTSLPVGNYEFEISACIDENKNICSVAKKIKINISAPWFKSTWFKYLTIAFVFILIALIMITRYRRLKSQLVLKNKLIEAEMDKIIFKKDLVQLEQKALLTQMNPHFIFNSLNTMQSFYLTGETKKGTQYLNLFSKLLRQILETSSKEFISLEKEKENMINYANLFNLKLEHNFEFNFNIDETIDAFEIKIPTMIIQPFIENSLLHGISNHKTTGIINIHITEASPNSIKVVITDNGIGRKMAAKNKVSSAEYESMGLIITQKRIEHINAVQGINTLINFIDLKDEEGKPAGTQVEFYLLSKSID